MVFFNPFPKSTPGFRIYGLFGFISVIWSMVNQILVQWSPLVRSTFCPKKFDHTSGLTIHPGCNKRLHVRPRAIYGCRLEFVIPSAAEAAVAAGVENTEAEVGLNSRRHP